MDPNNERDSLYWSAFKEGDLEAYSSLYNLYYRPLNNYGFKFTRDASTIEDSIQDLFVRLWKNRKNLGYPFSIRHYLYKSMRNILFRKIKTESRFFDLTKDDESIPFVTSYDHQLIQDEEENRLQQMIKEVLLKLSPRQQEIIYFRFYDGLSYEEIADIMNISVNSAYKLLYKALEAISVKSLKSLRSLSGS